MSPIQGSTNISQSLTHPSSHSHSYLQSFISAAAVDVVVHELFFLSAVGAEERVMAGPPC